MHHHHLLRIEAQEHHIRIDRGLGQGAIGHKCRTLRDYGNVRHHVEGDPTGFEQGGDVAVISHLVQRFKAMRHTADTTVAVILGRGGKRLVCRLDPEHTTRWDLARAPIRRGVRHRASVTRDALRRRVRGCEGDGNRGAFQT